MCLDEFSQPLFDKVLSVASGFGTGGVKQSQAKHNVLCGGKAQQTAQRREKLLGGSDALEQ